MLKLSIYFQSSCSSPVTTPPGGSSPVTTPPQSSSPATTSGSTSPPKPNPSPLPTCPSFVDQVLRLCKGEISWEEFLTNEGPWIGVGGVIAFILATVDRACGGRLAQKLLPSHHQRPWIAKIFGPTLNVVLTYLLRYAGGRNTENPLLKLYEADRLSEQVI